jgi:hypothetical protein
MMETHHALWSCCRPAWTHRVRTEDRRDSGRQSTRRHDRHPHCFGRQLDAFDHVDGCPWDLVLRLLMTSCQAIVALLPCHIVDNLDVLIYVYYYYVSKFNQIS